MSMADSFRRKYNLTLALINSHVNNKMSHNEIIVNLKVFVPDNTNSIDSIRCYKPNYGIYFKDGSCLVFDYSDEIFYQDDSNGPIQQLYENCIDELTEIIWQADASIIEETFCFDCSWYGSLFEPCDKHKKL